MDYFLFQPVLYKWYNKGSMYNPVYGMVHIKDPLLLFRKSILCHYLNDHLPYTGCHRSINVLNVLNKTFPSFLLILV